MKHYYKEYTRTEEVGAKSGDKFELIYPDVIDITNGYKIGDVFTYEDGQSVSSLIAKFICDKNDTSTTFYWEQLRPLKRIPTWETLQEGDVLVHENDTEITVQGKLGQVLLTTREKGIALNPRSIIELKRTGWRIKGTEPAPVEMTLADIERELGKKIELVGDE